MARGTPGLVRNSSLCRLTKTMTVDSLIHSSRETMSLSSDLVLRKILSCLAVSPVRALKDTCAYKVYMAAPGLTMPSFRPMSTHRSAKFSISG